MSVGAITAILLLWTRGVMPLGSIAHPPDTILSALLPLTVALAHRYPVHVHYSTKLSLETISLLLIAILLPPPLAAVCAAAGVLLGDLLVRGSWGLTWSDVATQTGRLTLAVAAASLVAHLPFGAGTFSYLPVIAGAGVLWVSDILTFPFLLASMTGEPYREIVRAAVRQSGQAEAALYMLGCLGALAASRAGWALILIFLPLVLVHRSFKTSKELQSETRRILEAMADAVDLRDPYTGGHSKRVAARCAEILRVMGKQGVDVDLILATARVHDIGKIGIPDRILLKPGQLTPKELAVMNAHAERGAQLVERYQDFARGVAIIRHHHEAWDGSGYPDKLRGPAIPFGARVIAVADSFDAMTSDRPYRAAMSAEQAVTILRQERGRQWDPEIVDAFLGTLLGPAKNEALPSIEPAAAGS